MRPVSAAWLMSSVGLRGVERFVEYQVIATFADLLGGRAVSFGQWGLFYPRW